MQTFLPHPNFVVSAMLLDYQRLGKQRVECSQLVGAITQLRRYAKIGPHAVVTPEEWIDACKSINKVGTGVGWSRHPCTLMWRNHCPALMLYADICVREWKRRGYENTMTLYGLSPAPAMPDWLGDPEFHASHRAALLEKWPEHYSRFRWEEEPKNDYKWPT